MAPPGVAMVAVSAAALARADATTTPRWYLDFVRERKFQEKSQTATTPAVGVLFAMQEGLAMMREEGLEAIWERHARVASMIRAGVDALGLRLLAAEGHRSDTVTAIYNPVDGADTLKELLTDLRTRHGLVLAGGQGDLAGKIFRIGHLGMIDDGDVYSILATLEQGLQETGMRSRVGLAVPAAQSVVRSVQVSGQPAGVS
jgi:aspartate aminotransferase-like enzyme